MVHMKMANQVTLIEFTCFFSTGRTFIEITVLQMSMIVIITIAFQRKNLSQLLSTKMTSELMHTATVSIAWLKKYTLDKSQK